MTVNCILAGVGGQGTVLASKLIAQAAMEKGQNVRTAETIGMAQRGGSVVSHVRIGKEIFSPLVPKQSADIIIGFEPGEAVRCISYLKNDGAVVVSKKAIRPVSDSLGKSSYNAQQMLDFLKENTNKLIIVDTDKICEDCGSSKVSNIALLGAACATGMLNLSLEEIEAAIKDRLPSKLVDINIKALKQGANS